jgi:hypothetical protein
MSEEIKLFQTIEKEHMEMNAKCKISDVDWEYFVEQFQNAFADEVSELALTYWIERKQYYD